MCSLRFDMEENAIIEAFLRFRFASVAITSCGLLELLEGYRTSKTFCRIKTP
jgi:hypothetical protein